jgi:hypothetical protein
MILFLACVVAWIAIGCSVFTWLLQQKHPQTPLFLAAFIVIYFLVPMLISILASSR